MDEVQARWQLDHHGHGEIIPLRTGHFQFGFPDRTQKGMSAHGGVRSNMPSRQGIWPYGFPARSESRTPWMSSLS